VDFPLSKSWIVSSWSSDDDTTTSSLNKVDDDATSDAHDDSTPCTLDDDDGSCSGYESDASTSPSPSPMRVMLLQVHHLHHIVSCHKMTQRYPMLMWLIMLIHMMSLLVDLLV
jgi:hypothetical protein